ncbi:hypothetical protein B0H66DRAFT_555711 [Apodospora peruviana]|uniref:Uncharacterized protein n=1 Tax=Apodospora peruviana TaxID=516989 RepID=A0AAE0IDP2_9PEZI|nr:hypothetical protein B0H66DRAFT_555711 [Apodospora peruviana]
MLRDSDQDKEDALCQRLLLLGVKWFDSDQRWYFILDLMDDDDTYVMLMDNEEPRPTAMERRWLAVAYPDGRGPETGEGLWVVEFDTILLGVIEEKDNLVP